MKEYHLRPWELDRLTITECSFLLLALRQGEQANNTTITEHDDEWMRAVKLDLMKDRLRHAEEYAALSPQEKLDDAYIRYYGAA